MKVFFKIADGLVVPLVTDQLQWYVPRWSVDGYVTTVGVADTPTDDDSVIEINEMDVDPENHDEDFSNVDVVDDNNSSLENVSST